MSSQSETPIRTKDTNEHHLDYLDHRSPQLFRKDLVHGILKQLEAVNFIQIHGSPASGKTILLNQIYGTLVKEGKRAILMDEIWPSDPEERVVLYTKLTDYRTEARNDKITTVILIDEGQTTYSDIPLWNTYYKTWGGYRDGDSKYFGIIIACAYGSASPFAMTGLPYTPMVLEDRQRIGLYPSANSPLRLLFNKAELEELLLLATASKAMPPINSDFRNTIFEWTSGYIAVVGALVNMFSAKDFATRSCIRSKTFTRSTPRVVF
ncbi:hypothetical protein B0H12DRAFT_264903 [Mycena haematopus]|nr:hypothetical protein B0H12DRAFT_264903 [Mycena haematopus]